MSTPHVPRADRPRVAVLTMVSGEHEHLLSQVDGLSVSTWPPDIHVVTSIRDRAVTRGRLPLGSDRWTTVVPVLPVPASRDAFLPGLQAAGRAALEEGAEVLIFLSVSCIPGRRLVQTLAEAAVTHRRATPTIWCSAVEELSPAPDVGYPVAGDLDSLVLPEPAPVVDLDEAGRRTRWREAFALTAEDWRQVVPSVSGAGPFDGAPVDIETVIADCSGEFLQVSGATAYRQHTAGTPELSRTGTA